jgi:hypothetical protein
MGHTFPLALPVSFRFLSSNYFINKAFAKVGMESIRVLRQHGEVDSTDHRPFKASLGLIIG